MCSVQPSEGPRSKTQVMAQAGKDVEQGNPPPLLVGEQTCMIILEINLAVSEKVGNSYSTPGYRPKRCTPKLLPVYGICFPTELPCLDSVGQHEPNPAETMCQGRGGSGGHPLRKKGRAHGRGSL